MTGYVRNDTSNNIAEGNIIDASDLDGEYDAIEAAFNSAVGHTHNGDVGEGGPITVLGPTQDVVITDTLLRPKTDNVLSLGSTSQAFKDLHVKGSANFNNLSATGVVSFLGATVDTLGTVNDIDINGGTIDGVSLGVNSPVLELQADNLNINGNTIQATNLNGNIVLNPNGAGIVDVTAHLNAKGANLNGAVFVNEDREDVDFRVRSRNGTDSLVVDGFSGSVGVSKDNPTATLHVGGGAIFEGQLVVQNGGQVNIEPWLTNGSKIRALNSLATEVPVDRDLAFYTGTTEVLRARGTGFNNNSLYRGWLGVGVELPQAPLHIKREHPFGVSLLLEGSSNSKLRFLLSAAGYGELDVTTGRFSLNGLNNTPVVLSTNGSERLRVVPTTGFVGINETEPNYRLDVNGPIGFTPGSSVTPQDNGDVVFELTNNTTLTIKAKGTDGIIRSGTITLS